MKYYFVLFTVLFFASTAWSQQPGSQRPTMTPPGGQRTMPQQTDPNATYPDSAQFKAAFKELYPLIRPTPTVQERAQTTYGRMLRMFKQRGVDSAKGYDTAMAAIDKSKDEKLLYNAYRESFTAEELKAIVTFFKTSAGKHYLEVESRLMDARGKALDQYVNQTISMAVAPMEKPIERRPRPGMPGAPGIPPGTPPVPATPPAH